ncbi:MAG: hypothetical protein L6R38_004478, partial [Xanthoria sp. 2 TBL-2021]
PSEKEKRRIKALRHPNYKVNSSSIPYEKDHHTYRPPNRDNFRPNPAQYRAAQKLTVLYQDKSASSLEERLDAVEAARVVIREHPEVKKGVADERGEGCDAEE